METLTLTPVSPLRFRDSSDLWFGRSGTRSQSSLWSSKATQTAPNLNSAIARMSSQDRKMKDDKDGERKDSKANSPSNINCDTRLPPVSELLNIVPNSPPQSAAHIAKRQTPVTQPRHTRARTDPNPSLVFRGTPSDAAAMRHPARVFFYQHLVDPKSGYERIESQYPNGRPPSPKPSSIERASGQPSTNQRSLSPPPMGRQIHNQDSKAQHLNGDHATNRYPSGQLPLPPPLSTCPNYFSPAGPLLPPPHPFWQLPCPQESSQPAPDRASYRALYEPKSYWQDSNNFNPLATRTHLQRRRRGNLPREAVTILRQWYETHPDNPYPNDEEKNEFVHRTGLTLHQVNNWFINARRRFPSQGTRRRNSRAHTAESEGAETVDEVPSESSPTDYKTLHGADSFGRNSGPHSGSGDC